MTGVRRLKAFPRNRLILHELCRCRVSELDLLEHLGEPTSQTDPRELEPIFYWDLEWDCGLISALMFSQISEELVVHLDEPEVDHALRHLGIDTRALWLWQSEEPDAFAAVVPELPDRAWSVWHRGPEGRRTCLASAVTERDARCWVAELGDHDHWAERLTSFPGTAPLPSRSAGPAEV